jgi:hypothetical protein
VGKSGFVFSANRFPSQRAKARFGNSSLRRRSLAAFRAPAAALGLRSAELARSFSWLHTVIPVYRFFRAKIASAAALHRFSGLHNNSFKPKPLRGSA